MEPADESDEGTTPTVAELEAYIQQLKRHIERLQQENRTLRAEVQEYQRRELLLVMQRHP